MAFKLTFSSKKSNKKRKPHTAKWGVFDKPKTAEKKTADKVKTSKNFGLKTALIVLISVIIVFLLAGSSVYAYGKIYENKIYPGVSVGGVNLGGLTVGEAKDLLKSKMENYKKDNIAITSAGKKWNPNLADLGFAADVDTSVSNAYAFGRNDDFFQGLKEQAEGVVSENAGPLVYKINNKTLSSYLMKISQSVDKPAVNATLAFEGADLKNVPPQKGLIIDKNDLTEQIKKNLNYLKTGSISTPMKIDEPKIKEKDTVEAREAAKAMISVPLTFTYEGQVYIANPNEIMSWIIFKPAKKASAKNSQSFDIPNKDIWYLKADLDENKVRGFLQDNVAGNINVEAKNTKITYNGSQKFVLEQGYDGKQVDMDNAYAQVKERVSESANRDIALAVKIVPAGEVEATSYGIVPITQGKYIDVSLSGQVLTCFDGGKALFMTLISSGISKYPSPAGTFSIYLKKVSTEMKGDYGPGNPDNYDLLNVPYAMFFSGSYSIHGTYWHSNFGYPMSHGCINAPTPAAAWIYDWAPVGTMVYLHW
jgi:lipoprotein-anchoring transpeptidase ErfK/SrfK